MTLPASGTISLGNNTGDTTTISVNRELGYASPYQQTISFNNSAVRALFGQASGIVDMNTGHGKANRTSMVITVSVGVQNFNVFNNRVTSQHGASVTVYGTYTAGKTDINVVVNSGIVVGSSSAATYAFDTGTGWAIGDAIQVTNNGYIVGKGGNGGNGGITAYNNNPTNGLAGGPAMNLQFPVSITNTSGYIYSGGGGGSGGPWTSHTNGSNGSGIVVYSPTPGWGGGGGAGNIIGAAGAAGGAHWWTYNGYVPIPNHPARTQAGALEVGGHGGGISAYNNPGPVLNPGLGVQGHLPAVLGTAPGGGGGGGGGANGGGGYRAGGGHGLAIQRNGNTINGQVSTWGWPGNARVYGGIS